MRAPTFGSLFAGVGGFDLGLEAAGWQCAFQVEWDKHCQSVLRHHWPTVPKWGDVQEVDGATLPPVDMITFGSPCQDLSVAGKRAGLQGGRSSMFFEATRIIREMRNATNNVHPRTAIWENVPGALTSNNGADFGAVLDEMAQLGAVAIEWRVLDAQHFGVPQRRRRVFVVAIFDPAIADRCPNPLLPVREGRRGDFAKGRKKGQDVAGTLGGGAGSRGWSPDTDRMTFVPENVLLPMPIQGTIIGRSDTAGPQGQGIGEPDGVMFTLDRVSQHGVAQPIIFDGTRHDDFGMDTEIVPTLKQRMGTGGGQVPMLAEPYSFDTQFGSNANVFTDMSPSLKASQQCPSVSTSLAVRRLTPLECERLMGWPDDHTRYTDTGKEQADTHRYKQCGNGVAAPVAEWIGRHLHPLHVHHD